ncbi:unnamed protein product [Effrenium voratum]|uniref:G8 domain-containing protein n=1 Tax=Effrenium voratum TaxID=2562239 RepID=A0AA36IQ46_9DINO|nr:unnamed protein product [Effrenium voratum]
MAIRSVPNMGQGELLQKVPLHATDTEATCVTSAAKGLGGDAVEIMQTCGQGLTASGVGFSYVTRWSQPSDWPEEEPPILSEELLIPAGSHVILDVQSGALSLLRVEGHLEVDLSRQDLVLESERIWLRGGRLTAEPDRNSSFSIHMAESEVVSPEVPGLGHLQLLVTDRQTENSAWPEAQGSLHLGAPLQSHRSSLLAHPVKSGSQVLELREALDLDLGDQVLVMGGSHSATELHEVTWLEDGGRILHLAAPLAFDREGGTRGLDAIIDEVFFNFGQVDLSATVASLRGSAFSAAAGGGSLRCASGGSCGVQGMVFSGCGQVSTGTAGLPCLTMRAVQEPHAAYVKQSAFLNAEGPAVLVQANSGTAEFSENVVMSPKGPGVTVSTLRGAVAPKAAVTVHGNQVVSPRTSAVGLPWFQHPVAFDMKTSAYYTENFASGAEACFLFDPREDSTETGVAVGLARFHGNVAHACTYGLLVVELREGETKVFDQFTVFASDYGAYVHGCDRCRLVNWAWVECNMGIFDKDSAPIVTDDPWIENATAVGTRQMFGAFEVNLGPQVMLSEREGRRIRNMTFFLFGNSPCVHGGFRPVTVRTEAMRFIQSFVEIYTLAPAGYAIFADLDGSLSGQRGGFVTGDKIYNRHSSCTSAGSDASRRLLCSSDIFVRALKITGVQPAELVGTDLVVWSIFGTGNVPYTDGWHFTVVGAVQREDFVWPLRRWAETGPTPVEWRMLPFWYTLKADSHLDWQRLRVSYGAPGVMTKSEWVGFHFTYRQTPVRQFEAIGVSGSCFEPYYDWLDRGGYALWAPEILFTTTRTLTSTVTLTSSTTFTSTSSITSTTTQSTTSSTTTFELMDDNDTNDTNESNETNITTTTSTVTTSTSTTATNTSTTTMTTTSSSSTVSSTITTSSTSQTTTSRSSTTTTTSYLGSRTSTSTETTITMTTTTTSTSTTVPLAAPLRTLSVFPEPRFGCGALSFQFEFCERAGGLPYGPCLPDGPVVGWTNFTEMVNSTLFANGTVAVMMANSDQGDFQNPLVADLVNTGCGEGGCAFVEEARVVMGPPGNWTLPESWPGRQLPIGMDQLVVIPPYYHIVYNNFTAIGMVGDLKVYGKLSMAEEEGLKLLVKSIQVHAGGVMQVGTSYAPHRTTAIISFWGVTYDSFPAYISTNTEWGRKVFGVYEGNVSLHGKAYTHSWGELFVTAEPGDEMIRVREDVGDWPVGSEIALTTNEYPSLNGTFTERRFIVSIVFYPPSTEIVLDRPLHHRHFAGKAFEDSSGTLNIHSKVALLSRSILVTTEEAFTGAERFPDAERGVPIAGHGGEWFGQHMVVSGASFLSMSWVQLNRGGQDGLGLTRFPALRVFQPEIYTRNLPRPYLEAVSFTDSYIRALEVVGSWGLDLLDSVFCSTRGPALEAGVDMGSFFLLRNLAIDTRPEPPGAELGLTYEPTAVFQLQARPTVFAGNVVAGGPDIGVMMRPHTCEEVAEAPEPEMNEVFGCVVGFFVLRSCVTEGGGPAACPQSWDCVHITKLQAWKNAHVGILFVDQPANMIISDVTVFDNHIGITGIFHRQMGDMLHSFILRDSKVYGSTELSSCQASLQCLAVGPNDARPERCHSVPGPSFRRVGILLPIITNRGKTCEDGPVLRACPMAILPERDCAMPWELRYGNRGSRMSSQRIEDVYFGGFQPEDCGLRSVAIAYNPSSRDFNPPLDVRGLKWAEAPIFSKTVTNYSLKMEGPTARSHPDYVNSRILLEPWTGYQGEGSCGEPTLSEAVRRKLGVEGELPFCPGMQQTWLRDVDASLLNAGPVVLLPTQSLLPAQCDVTSSDFVGTTLVPSALPPPCEQCGGTWAHTLDGGLTACADRMRMLNWESLDPDCCGFYRRELGMLRATRPDGAYEETWPMFDESCPRGLEYGRSSYIIRVEAGLSLELRFLGSSRLPRLSRLHFFAESVQDEVLLQIPLGRLRRPRLYIFGINFDIMRRTAIPNVGDSHGAMFLDRDLLRLYVMVRGMPGGLQGQGVLLQLLEVFEAEVVVFVPLEEFSEFVFVADVSRSLNVSQDRVALVDIRYDGQKWLAGPNGRRLEMVDTLRIKFEVSEDPDSLSAFALSDRAWDPPGAYNAFFEESPR